MKRNAGIFCFLALTLAAWSGCSGQRPVQQAKKTALDRIQGKAQLMVPSGSAAEAALNAGGMSAYLWEGDRRYRLFLRTPFTIEHGKEYVAEGINAQRVIDEIGDPDQGANGYPLDSSCEHVVRVAWPGLSFNVVGGHASALRTIVKRYPARPVLLVTRIRLATAEEIAAAPKNDADDEEKELPTVSVAADQQRAFQIEGPKVLAAPLWEPAGATVRCKLIINSKGKIAKLETGAQLCEAVPWSQFRYQPPLRRGRPVRVETEVEVCFEPRE